MRKLLTREFELVVVGAGPAGLAAAVAAAESGVNTALIDDNPDAGGQIWRGDTRGPHAEALAWTRKLDSCGVTVFRETRAFHRNDCGWLFAETPEETIRFQCEKLILATGARERFLPFPGWTLPNVMGAGGLQALAKSGLPMRGKRVAVAGSGPLLLAVAAYLRQHGAEIPLICEQASWHSLVRFSFALASHPAKIAQTFQLRRALKGIPFAPNSWPVRAVGDRRLEAVQVSHAYKTETIACDYLACGFHLFPNTELASLLGCEMRNGFVRVDEFQQTSLPDVFCAGEPAGIGGLELALVEGQIAGLVAARRKAAAADLFAKRRKLQKFAHAMERAFRLRPELMRLPEAGTIICRCEDATYRQLQQHESWRAGKLHARCGMGPCQGRICGPATQFLFGWQPDSVRPPILPVTIESLAAISTRSETERELAGEPT
jgi:NADPH-dependent 2,4-dienoyl-CoA reductase/sulfur reductase-like enzyme